MSSVARRLQNFCCGQLSFLVTATPETTTTTTTLTTQHVVVQQVGAKEAADTVYTFWFFGAHLYKCSANKERAAGGQ